MSRAAALTSEGCRAYDWIEREWFSPLDEGCLQIIDLCDPGSVELARQLTHTDAVVLGVDREGRCPQIDPAHYDVLLTTAEGLAAPWVGVSPDRLESRVATLVLQARRTPMAAAMLCKVLRIAEQLDHSSALFVESCAYSTLLAGGEFARWRRSRPVAPQPSGGHRVAVSRAGDQVTITLDNPESRNAIDAPMRDALFNALAAVLDDPTQPEVVLQGTGSCFSTGGALAEFGEADDLAFAHWVRTLRSSSGLLMELGAQATSRLTGACIGSGIEIPAAAANRIASADVFVQLPEVRMGLIPGAGGTVTIPRAIGRHRTAYMALSGRRIPAIEALQWGLVTEIAP